MKPSLSLALPIVVSGLLCLLVGALEAAEPKLRTTLGGGTPTPGMCVAFSPDGKTLASGGLDGVKLWDLSGGKDE